MKCERNLNERDRVRILQIGKDDGHYRKDNTKRWVGYTGILVGRVGTRKCNRKYYAYGKVEWDGTPPDQFGNPYFAQVILEKIEEAKP